MWKRSSQPASLILCASTQKCFPLTSFKYSILFYNLSGVDIYMLILENYLIFFSYRICLILFHKKDTPNRYRRNLTIKSNLITTYVMVVSYQYLSIILKFRKGLWSPEGSYGIGDLDRYIYEAIFARNLRYLIYLIQEFGDKFFRPGGLPVMLDYTIPFLLHYNNALHDPIVHPPEQNRTRTYPSLPKRLFYYTFREPVS